LVWIFLNLIIAGQKQFDKPKVCNYSISAIISVFANFLLCHRVAFCAASLGK
jgi:uncharacterized membrane protein